MDSAQILTLLAACAVCVACSDSRKAVASSERAGDAQPEAVQVEGEPPVNLDGPTLTAPENLALVEYAIPNELGSCAAAAAYPHDPAVDDATGLVYYADTTESCIGQLNPESLELRAWPSLTPNVAPQGLVVADGVVYFTAMAANVLGRIDPATGVAEEFPVDVSGPHTPSWQNGAVWFTGRGGQYGRLDPVTQTSQASDFSSDQTAPYGIWPAPDGSVWVALYGTNRLARIDASASPASSEELVLPVAESRPRRLAVDARGRVWYTDYPRRTLGLMDPFAPEGARFKEFPTPGGGRPCGIAIGPDGRVWYNDYDSAVIVGFDQETESVVAELPLTTPNPGPVRNIDVDEERQRIWLAMSDVGRLAAVIQF
jgi:virginiamycin B lyase